MSMDKSLKRNKWKEKRNVRKRYERVEKLIKEARFLKSVYNLPKEKIVRLKIKKLKEEKKEETSTPIIDIHDTLSSTKIKEKKKSKDTDIKRK